MRHSVRVLLVEDSVAEARLIQEYLGESRAVRFEVSQAGSLESALLCARAGFDVVLLDLSLPDSRGLETLSRMREAAPAVPVVILTGLDDEAVGIAAVHAGAEDYLVKGSAAYRTLGRALLHALERRAAAEALQRSEVQYRLLFEASPTPMYIFDAETLGLRAANGAALALFGYERDEFLSLALAALLPEAGAASQLDALREGADRQSSAWLQRRKDGGLVEAEVTVSRLGFDGRPSCLVALRDVTRQNSALRQLRESEERFRQMAGAISQVFWMTDPGKDQMLYVSPAYESIWGRSCESLRARPREWLESVHPDDRSRVEAALPRQPRGTYDVTYRIVRPDGSTRWIRDRAYPVKDAQGRFALVTGVAEDVSEQMRTEEALRESREFLEKAQHVAHIGSWVLDLAGGRLEWSEESCRIFGVAPGVPRSADDFFALVHPDDRARVKAAKAAGISKGLIDQEYRIRRPDGCERTLHSRASVLSDAAGAPCKLVGIVQDVTDAREAERKLAETEERLRQAQKMEAVGRLAGGVAHDFNNILTAIVGLTEYSIRELPEGETRRDMEEILACAMRAANLTQQLLAFSRRQLVKRRVIVLDESILGLVRMLERIIGEDVQLEVQPNAGSATLLVDPGQIQQLIVNLVVNARDAMPHGGRLVISTEALALDAERARERGGLAPGSYVAVAVADTGVGIAPEVMSHIFEPFFTTKGPGQGTGLGLSTCYGIARQNGGSIECRSAPGAGATFTVLLPRANEATDAAPERPQPLRRGGETVLVVEDEAAVRKLVRRILAELGYRVIEASDGAEGLARIDEDADGRIGLVLTDVVMPRMGGRRFVDAVRARRPAARVLFTSGYTDDVLLREGALEPGVGLLPKPFTARDLAEKVREVLDRGS